MYIGIANLNKNTKCFPNFLAKTFSRNSVCLDFSLKKT